MPVPETPGCDPLTRLVSACLRSPGRSQSLTLVEWNTLLLTLRRNGLLGSFGERLAAAGLLEQLPPKARTHIAYARIAAESARTAVRFEVNRMLRALRGYEGPLILLKGAAYEFHALPAAIGRLSGDLDVMVPRARIDEVERRLIEHGWQLANQNEYDQRYYRQWTHEIPALLHPQRETPIDLHHTIAPLTGRAHPNAEALLADAVPTSSIARLQVLGPADMVLHSTLHLFNEEVSRPLRDLFDIHLLLSHFGHGQNFWDRLRERAELHGVQRPLFYMLQIVRYVFATDVPTDVIAQTTGLAPNPILRRGMRALFRARFAAGFVGSRRFGYRVVRGSYYLRAHWLRMPPLMLARHLAHKGVRRAQERMRGGADVEAEVV
jgi:hypothetical protein